MAILSLRQYCCTPIILFLRSLRAPTLPIAYYTTRWGVFRGCKDFINITFRVLGGFRGGRGGGGGGTIIAIHVIHSVVGVLVLVVRRGVTLGRAAVLISAGAVVVVVNHI